MGLSLVRAVAAATDLQLVAGIIEPDNTQIGRDVGELAGIGPSGVVLGTTLPEADIMLDFSAPRVMQEWASRCASEGIALLSGTTGLNEADQMALARASEKVPVVWAPNMSIGVQLLYGLSAQVARSIGDSADIEIFEVHHRHKVDAPSGTALEIGRTINQAMDREPEAGWVLSREGGDCRRQAGEIGFSASRTGDVIGDHTVIFGLDGERLEVTHRASSREAFVNGALLAARWLVQQSPGQYRFQDVLGL
jgi:4-hydroxy-tetrahydrodipicolinate reductase